MKHNRTIQISEHAIDRFIERFEFAGKHSEMKSAVRVAAETAIVEMWKNARYVSDDHKGVLMRSHEYGCDFIIQKKKMITLFKTNPNGKPQPGNESTMELNMKHNNSRFRKQRR